MKLSLPPLIIGMEKKVWFYIYVWGLLEKCENARESRTSAYNKLLM